MPLDLLQSRGQIDETDATFRDVLGDLQGNILVGHGRFHAVHHFLSFRADRIAVSWQRAPRTRADRPSPPAPEFLDDTAELYDLAEEIEA